MKLMRSLMLFPMILVCLLGGTAAQEAPHAANTASTANSPPPPLSSAPAASASTPRPSTATRRVVVPAETAIPLRLLTTINSRTAYVGEPVFCRTVYPVAVDNRIVIPVGTYVKGSLTEVKNPRAIKGRSQLGMRFDNMTFPNGMTLDLAAALSGYGGAGEDSFKPSEGRVGGGETQSKVQAAEIITVTAAEGSLIGALSSRSATGGDVGAAAGGGGMLALMLLSRSKPVIMGPGTSLELRLTRPISFDPKYLGRSNVDFQSEETVPPPEDAPPRIHRYIPPDR